jgi:hypothetical protein
MDGESVPKFTLLTGLFSGAVLNATNALHLATYMTAITSATKSPAVA